MAFLVNFKKFTRDISFCDNFARVDIEKKNVFWYSKWRKYSFHNIVFYWFLFKLPQTWGRLTPFLHKTMYLESKDFVNSPILKLSLMYFSNKWKQFNWSKNFILLIKLFALFFFVFCFHYNLTLLCDIPKVILYNKTMVQWKQLLSFLYLEHLKAYIWLQL